MMKYFELDKQEKKISKDFEAGKFKRVAKVQGAKKKYQEIAKVTLKKTRHINIRLTERDLQKVKAKAAEKGIPYQTLVASILHQYADDRIKAEL